MKESRIALVIVLLTWLTASVVRAQHVGDSSPSDTIRASPPSALRFPVAKTIPSPYSPQRPKAVDLSTPSNIKTEVEYNPATQNYIVRTRLGNREIALPYILSRKEYLKLLERESFASYFRQKISEKDTSANRTLDLQNLQFSMGPADRIFGPGGIRLQTQGSVEVGMGVKQSATHNPSLPESARSRTYFDFNENVQLNINAKVGDRMNFGMNYNTEATFDFDSKKLKLAYEGKEDEVLKILEAGNVTMPTSSSLIRGTQALFGIKAGLQFGKLKLTTVISQQESESKTLNMQGGAQLIPFELRADQYDENRHFFLSHYFYRSYDQWMSKLPHISSGITINRVEVWVTNKRGNYDQARDIVAFADMAESDALFNDFWRNGSVSRNPANGSNALYSQVSTTYLADRIMSNVGTNLAPLEASSIMGGQDYEKVENARRLESTEYKLNSPLGYISLNSALQPDEVLAVAFEYTYLGLTYQVGEFSTDNTGGGSLLLLKLLKGALASPHLPTWKLMMKNIYSLNSYQVQEEKFKLDIKYQSDTTGTTVNYLPEGTIKGEILLRVMNLDRLNSRKEPYPDGFFDFVEDYTIISQNGKIVFPVTEPFGSHLAAKIGSPALASKYLYQELYDSTLTVARQVTEKNKFVMSGEFKSTSGSEIRLGAVNVPPGSVRVTAGGSPLVENVDYTVDYMMGSVTIINQTILNSRTPVSVTMENQSTFSMQRKTLLGFDTQYEINKDFHLFGTVIHLSERPLTTKISVGNDPVSNTIWGLGVSYKIESQWLTNMVDKLPFTTASLPSRLSVQAEVANLLPGHPKEIETQGIAYIDDFEAAKTGMDLRSPYAWALASIPYDPSNKPLFAEAAFPNEDVRINKNRSLLAWYRIDGIFTRNTQQTPAHIRNDKEQLSNHFVREVLEQELFPNKEALYGSSSILPVFNLSYYPLERGPYNLEVDEIADDFTPLYPEKRWGGVMRKMDNTDFEAANYEYIQFWVMDPFVYTIEDETAGGDLYFNLGELSEDILRDSKKFFENGIGSSSPFLNTAWGKVPKNQSLVYAFDSDPGKRKEQDVGFNGLQTTEELIHPTYQTYVQGLEAKLNESVKVQMRQDPFSPFNDPGGDNYHYYRGDDYDRQQTSILDRYKRYNGTEGNSLSSEDLQLGFDASSRTSPDVEDINQDNTLNEYERYFEYKVSIRPNDMVVGRNFIVDKREASVRLANGEDSKVNWYQFKIPIRDYQRVVGSIRDFKTIRFMRMILKGFRRNATLRFGTFDLVRGDWRTYTQPLNRLSVQPISNGTIDVSVVNIEENGSRKPVNYVLPPGISRVIDPGQPQLRQQNEQALSMTLAELAPGDARGIYKNIFLDMRQYQRIQMFVHAEALIDNNTDLDDTDLCLFVRLGSDTKSNYYEYEIPLYLTPEGQYSTHNPAHQEMVWPKGNMVDVLLSTFTDLKLKRNADKRQQGSDVTFGTLFSSNDPNKQDNKVSIIGNPSLAEVRTILIGVRNGANRIKAGTVWVNELRMTNFDEKGGWAAKANVNLALSDIATINAAGHFESAGFGGVEQRVQQRRMDDYFQYNLSTTVEIGRLLPEKLKLKAPLYYAISEQTSTPKYNPIDKDILISESIEGLTSEEKDSLLFLAQDKNSTRSFSLSNARFDIRSKNPMPYDPANFSFSYAYSENYLRNPTTQFDVTKNYKGNFSYSYAPMIKPLKPFTGVGGNNKNSRFIREFSINYLPTSITFSTTMSRYYNEQQFRDLSAEGVNSTVPLSFRKDFVWDRQFSLVWNIARLLRFDISTGTNAQIDEPNVAVNKRLFPDEYEMWKDSVWNNILSFGRPMNYTQTANASYDFPLGLLPALDWITAGAKYNSSYNWDRGAMIDSTVEIGNVIRNQGALQLNGRFGLDNLYNKSRFLREVNRKFAMRSNASRSSPSLQSRPIVRKKMERSITLSTDSAVTLVHNLDNKNLIVRARKIVGTDTTSYPLIYKPLGRNAIKILNRDSTRLLISILQGLRPEEAPLYKTAQYVSRFLMMLRSVSFSYRSTNSMLLPYFKPDIGGFFGQGSTGGGLAPGLDFALGMSDENYIERAKDEEWLILNDSLVTPATVSRLEEFHLTAQLEPIPGLKIDLNANRVISNNQQIQFMFENSSVVRGGSFTMTTIAIASRFDQSTASNDYASKSFDRLLDNIETIVVRLQKHYNGSTYPNSGFLKGTQWANTPYQAKNGEVNPNSPDVLVPAFIAAYTGKSADEIDLSPFPSLKTLLPNWRATYNGFMGIPFFKKHFKRFDFSHAYRCTYSVGSFTSYMNWADLQQDDLGFIRDVQSGNPTPSSPYSISSAAITEGFAPLIGFDATLQSNITFRAEYRNTRNVSLNVSSNQIVEAFSEDITVGTGYKIANFRGFKKNLFTKRQSAFSTDLNLRGDITYSLKNAFIRRIEQEISDPTSGNRSFILKLSADWMLSRALTLRAYYDRQISRPLISSSAFPMSNSNFGMSVKFMLTR